MNKKFQYSILCVALFFSTVFSLAFSQPGDVKLESEVIEPDEMIWEYMIEGDRETRMRAYIIILNKRLTDMVNGTLEGESEEVLKDELKEFLKNNHEIIHPVQIRVQVSPTQVRSEIYVKITAKNVSEKKLDKYDLSLGKAPYSGNVAVWISHEQLKEVYPCLKPREPDNLLRHLNPPHRSLPPYLTSQSRFLAPGEEIIIYEEYFTIPGVFEYDLPIWVFWNAWLQLPDEQRPNCQINLRIAHPMFQDIHFFSHGINIQGTAEIQRYFDEKISKSKEQKPLFRILYWNDGEVETIHQVVKEWNFGPEDSR